MKLFRLGCDRQLGIRSGVVNVPIDMKKTIKSIPVTFDETEVIEVSLKRKLEYNHPYMKEMIRPKVIREAAELLCNTPLYKEEGITLSDNYDNMEGKTRLRF